MKNKSIKIITKSEANLVLSKYHYLSNESKGFKSGVNYGLFHDDNLIGVCIFTGFPVPELTVSIFGLSRTDQEGFFELSRLCLIPEYQNNSNKNLLSYFVANSIKILRKAQKVRAILSYADSRYHKGTIYQACNFKYYGLTDKKKDFYIKTTQGYIKHSRGSTKGIEGEWRDRSQKHRYLLTFDKKLNIIWKEDKYPK